MQVTLQVCKTGFHALVHGLLCVSALLDLLPTLAPSTVDAMTAQPTTNLETPTATETDTVVQATNCANISSQAGEVVLLCKLDYSTRV
jgi:hypothetical protein